jgi:hypothetical protein
VNNLLWLADDPTGDVLDLVGMGSDLDKLARGK